MPNESVEEQILFWKQLRLLVSSGVSLHRALSTASVSITHELLKQAIEEITAQIEEGSTLADAMRSHGELFSEIAITLVEVGEDTATLAVQMDEIATGLETGIVPVGGARPVGEVREPPVLSRTARTSPQVRSSIAEPGTHPEAVDYVNELLLNALHQRASDVHIEPSEDGMRVRYRVDGVLREAEAPPKAIQQTVVDVIKLSTGMDVAQRGFPQDGKMLRIDALGEHSEQWELDLRVSCVPSQWGEAMTFRFLHVRSVAEVSELGFSPTDQQVFETAIRQPHGLVLVSGPTGSGKTTTLYAALKALQSTERKLLSIEDPVEASLSGVTQIRVHPERGLTFPVGIRSILRQDPDIVLVGELRDYQTAEMTTHVALTGHLVLSALHANDAPGAVRRFIEMGVEPFLVGTALTLVVSQRLVRRLCSACKQPVEASEELLGLLEQNRVDVSDASTLALFQSSGCSECGQTGFRGRTGVFELLSVDEEMREAIVGQASAAQLRCAAEGKGMASLRVDGLQKAVQGVTTVDEVLRVTSSHGSPG